MLCSEGGAKVSVADDESVVRHEKDKHGLRHEWYTAIRGDLFKYPGNSLARNALGLDSPGDDVPAHSAAHRMRMLAWYIAFLPCLDFERVPFLQACSTPHLDA